jgi:hypothetical protein
LQPVGVWSGCQSELRGVWSEPSCSPYRQAHRFPPWNIYYGVGLTDGK